LSAGILLLITLGPTVYLWRASRAAQPSPSHPSPADPNAALEALRLGNLRFVNSARTQSTDTAHDAEYRHETCKEQHPFAAILCCSDSRVVPEFVFDQRAGRLFEIRNAGNVVDEDGMASIEYAVEHLHVPLVLILAHKGCGAIKAVCEAGDRPLHGHLRDLQNHMQGIRKGLPVRCEECTPELLDRLSIENARQQADVLLKECQILKTAIDRQQTRLLYGIYDMDSGKVQFFVFE
jgi:carbonic anhydrase